ncbi:terminase small subunit [Anaerococcus tetradius]|uniref:terminase small subunit n=1 Tax=Anaerococcus tetradius TaxID=33036 RepID=UPI00207008FC|nr:terminase small subunit [Anaerococcus tetradius]DAK50556.1 MAG TPA: Terminase small subunit [Caudoviricetes sp.]
MTKLTIKQKKFADEYIKSGNAYQSAINAGYSKSYAKGNIVKLLENVSVKAYIDKKLSELESETIAESKEVLQYLTSVLRGETHDEVYYKTEFGGEALGQVKVQNKDRLKAAELLMRRFGLNASDLDIEKQQTQIKKTKTEIEIMKGISEEVEDLDDIDGMIYGKD